MSNLVTSSKGEFGLPNPDEIELPVSYPNKNNVIELKNEEVQRLKKEAYRDQGGKEKVKNKKEEVKGKKGKVKEKEKDTNVIQSGILPYIRIDNNGKAHINKGLLADYMAEIHPYICVNGRFFFYKDGVYCEQNHEEPETLIREHIGSENSTSNLIAETKKLWAWIAKHKKNNEEINNNENLINVKNGILNIDTMELIPHNKDIVQTIQIQANYREDLTEEDGKAFTKFLNEVVPDKDTQKVLQEVIGYSLTHYIRSKKMIFLLVGMGDSGKSTFVNNTIGKLLQPKDISNVELQEITKQFHRVALFGKTVNYRGDIDAKEIKETGLLKAATGSDPVTAEYKGQDVFSFVNKAKLIFSCNKLPSNYSKDKTNAFYKRFSIIPFFQEITQDKQDPFLDKKLEKELDFIFMWAIKGLERLMKNDFIFSKSQECENMMEEYRKDNDYLLQFLNDYCEVTNYPNDYIIRSRFHKVFYNYCKEEFNSTYQESPKDIKDSLSDSHGIVVRKKQDYSSKRKSGEYSRSDAYIGIKFKNELIENGEVEDIWNKINEKNSYKQ